MTNKPGPTKPGSSWRAGRGSAGGYVLADDSSKIYRQPEEWPARAVSLYDTWVRTAVAGSIRVANWLKP